MAKLFFFAILLKIAFSLTLLLVNCQDQSDFISIDCGASENYTDKTTGIRYATDDNYTDTGESRKISPEFETRNLAPLYQNVRAFPQGRKNCYTLRPSQGKNNSYLIRASFLYGNYDGQTKFPEFDLYIGVNKWRTVKLEDANSTRRMEIIHVPQSDHIYVCLVKTGPWTPFISVLELRLLNKNSYITQSGSLELFARLDCGLTPNSMVRYKDDVLDRIWTPFNYEKWDVINNKSLDFTTNYYEPPSVVMSTAVTPRNLNDSLGFSWTNNDQIEDFYMYLHFAELLKLKEGQFRAFNIYLNGALWFGPLVPDYLSLTTIYSMNAKKGSYLDVWINKTENSTLPPLLNAFEIYKVKYFLYSETNQNDVDAIMNVKSTYKLEKIWQGDPCAPSDYIWQGLNCSFNDFDPPRIIYLNLSSSGLSGEIDPHISNLTLLEELDLSNNNLSGLVPDFLSQMPSLRVLNLGGNNFSGSLPIGLQEKSKNNSIFLSVEGNPYLCSSTPCNKKNEDNKKIIIPVVASVGGFLLLLLAAGIMFWCLRRRTQESDAAVTSVITARSNHQDKELEVKKQQFSYSEVLHITNNFGRILGKGGFGTVYHGFFSDGQVAVKMLSHSSAQGYKQFQAEAKLLTRVHHRSLTALVGYCDEGPNMGLVYEYMSNGDLAWHLSDRNANPLSWEERLKIALDAAQGLEYLHSGCKPSIIHRDVKTTNILLNEKLQAKLSDFGLSRAFPLDGDTHVSTTVVGTPGYVDPEYYVSNRLTEKSDVYGFGVVLLEIITGRPAIIKNNINGQDHVIEWVQHWLSKGDVKDLVDPKLEQKFNKNSAWKAVEVAMTCISQIPTRRPTMTQIVIDLKQCLEIEMASNNTSDMFGSTEFIEMFVDTDSGPLAR